MNTITILNDNDIIYNKTSPNTFEDLLAYAIEDGIIHEDDGNQFTIQLTNGIYETERLHVRVFPRGASHAILSFVTDQELSKALKDVATQLRILNIPKCNITIEVDPL